MILNETDFQRIYESTIIGNIDSEDNFSYDYDNYEDDDDDKHLMHRIHASTNDNSLTEIFKSYNLSEKKPEKARFTSFDTSRKQELIKESFDYAVNSGKYTEFLKLAIKKLIDNMGPYDAEHPWLYKLDGKAVGVSGIIAKFAKCIYIDYLFKKSGLYDDIIKVPDVLVLDEIKNKLFNIDINTGKYKAEETKQKSAFIIHHKHESLNTADFQRIYESTIKNLDRD